MRSGVQSPKMLGMDEMVRSDLHPAGFPCSKTRLLKWMRLAGGIPTPLINMIVDWNDDIPN